MGSTIAQDSVSFMFYEKARSVFLLFRVASPSPVLAPVGRGHASVIAYTRHSGPDRVSAHRCTPHGALQPVVSAVVPLSVGKLPACPAPPRRV